MKRLTIKDIANHFNVSISTVSKALNKFNDFYEEGFTTEEIDKMIHYDIL